MSTTLGLYPVSSSPPQTNWLHNAMYVNWPVVYPESSYKIIDAVSLALPQNL